MSYRRQHLNALKQEVIIRILSPGRWQTLWYMYPLKPCQWGLLKRWMARGGFEFRTPCSDDAVSYFEFAWTGVKPG